MSREEKIQSALRLIWRNLPSVPSTFGPCSNRCGRGLAGRGGGPCPACAQDQLAALCSEAMAARYVATCQQLRELEQAILENIPHA